MELWKWIFGEWMRQKCYVRYGINIKSEWPKAIDYQIFNLNFDIVFFLLGLFRLNCSVGGMHFQIIYDDGMRPTHNVLN